MNNTRYHKISLSIIIVALVVTAGFFIFLINKKLNKDKFVAKEKNTLNNIATQKSLLESASASEGSGREVSKEVMDSLTAPSGDKKNVSQPNFDPAVLKSLSVNGKQ